MMKGHLAHHYSHLGLSLLFQTALSARADLEAQRDQSTLAEVSRDDLLAKRTLSRVLKAGQALFVRTEERRRRLLCGP